MKSCRRGTGEKKSLEREVLVYSILKMLSAVSEWDETVSERADAFLDKSA
jgi:hypothetical protein